MSTVLKLTADEYDEMIARGAFVGINKKIELIRGELREMNPSGPVHADYIDYLTRWSVESTIGSGIVVRVQSGIDADDSRPEPDLVWLKPGRYTEKHPDQRNILLVIEISESTLRYDRGEKNDIYAEQGITEYWIVDVKAKCIRVLSDPVNGAYQDEKLVPSTGVLSPMCFGQAELVLAELFIASSWLFVAQDAS